MLKLVIAGNQAQFRQYLQQYNIDPLDRLNYKYISSETQLMGVHAGSVELILTGEYWLSKAYGSPSYAWLLTQDIKITEQAY